jgi:hypothetical protein
VRDYNAKNPLTPDDIIAIEDQGGIMDELDLPSTDSPEVMEQAVSIWLTHIIWDQHSRGVHPDQIEENLVDLYSRVYRKVREAHER